MRNASRTAGRVVLAVVGSVVVGIASARAAGPAGLPGTWVFAQEGVRIKVVLRADKTFTRTQTMGTESVSVSGTYSVQGSKLVVRPAGSSERLAFGYRLVGANTLQLTEAGAGNAIQLVRAGTPAKRTKAAPARGASAELRALIASLNRTVDPDGARRITIPGWPTVGGPWGSFQHPRGWTTRARTDYGAWVSDPRGLTCIALAVLDTFPGSPTFEQFRDAINRRFIGGARIEVLATWDRQLRLRGAHPDDGRARIWCYRWTHPSGRRMFGVLRVTVLARGPLRTNVSWGTNQCPEAEATTTWKTIFRPSDRTAWFPIPKGGRTEPDRDGDGIADGSDPDPDDPNVR